jgi:hypothetical protein
MNAVILNLGYIFVMKDWYMRNVYVYLNVLSIKHSETFPEISIFYYTVQEVALVGLQLKTNLEMMFLSQIGLRPMVPMTGPLFKA